MAHSHFLTMYLNIRLLAQHRSSGDPSNTALPHATPHSPTPPPKLHFTDISAKSTVCVLIRWLLWQSRHSHDPQASLSGKESKDISNKHLISVLTQLLRGRTIACTLPTHYKQSRDTVGCDFPLCLMIRVFPVLAPSCVPDDTTMNRSDCRQ